MNKYLPTSSSGIGIPHIYEHLRDIEHVPETPEVAQLIASARDPSAVIIASAVDPQNPSKLCAATIDMLVSILANEAANLALKVFSTGGDYVAGGIPMRILRALQAPRFMKSFERKGRFSELIEGTDVCESIYQPFASRPADMRVGRLRTRGGNRSRPRRVGLR